MALPKRAITQAAPTPAASEALAPNWGKTTGVNFGDLGLYVAGGGLPEGDYIWSNLQVMMYQAKSQAGVARGPARLGVMITLLPLDDPKPENERTQFYSMGSSADKSFAPNPETGKGLVAIPGAAGATLNNTTNWALLLQSLYSSGLPQGIFINDVSVLEGMWVHMMNVPEPEERKGFIGSARTGEATADEPRRDNKIAIVSEIKDDGKPWEGTGGIPAQVKTNGQAALKAPARAVQAAPAKSAAAAAAAEPADNGSGDIYQAALDGIEAVLGNSPKGVSRLALSTGTFKALSNAVSEDMAQAVIDTYFKDDKQLATLLAHHGYTISGKQIVPSA